MCVGSLYGMSAGGGVGGVWCEEVGSAGGSVGFARQVVVWESEADPGVGVSDGSSRGRESLTGQQVTVQGEHWRLMVWMCLSGPTGHHS